MNSLRWDLWQPGLGVVDVTNPAARKWYQDKLDALIDLGVDTFKVCFSTNLARLLLTLAYPWHRPTSESEYHMHR